MNNHTLSDLVSQLLVAYNERKCKREDMLPEHRSTSIDNGKLHKYERRLVLLKQLMNISYDVLDFPNVSFDKSYLYNDEMNLCQKKFIQDAVTTAMHTNKEINEQSVRMFEDLSKRYDMKISLKGSMPLKEALIKEYPDYECKIEEVFANSDCDCEVVLPESMSLDEIIALFRNIIPPYISLEPIPNTIFALGMEWTRVKTVETSIFCEDGRMSLMTYDCKDLVVSARYMGENLILRVKVGFSCGGKRIINASVCDLSIKINHKDSL